MFRLLHIKSLIENDFINSFCFIFHNNKTIKLQKCKSELKAYEGKNCDPQKGHLRNDTGMMIQDKATS